MNKQNQQYQAKNPYIITISSTMASIATQLLCSPFGVIGVRQQKAYKLEKTNPQHSNINNQNYNNLWQTAVTIYKQEGFKTFFNGIRYSMLQTVIGSITMFLSYEKIMEILNKKLNNITQSSFLASIGVSFINTTVSFPFEYWKTLSQAQTGVNKLHNFQLGDKIYSAYFMTLQRNVIIFASWFPTMEFCKSSYKQYISSEKTYGHVIGSNVVSGFIAGGISGIVSQPFDICKNRKQIFSDFDKVKGSLRIIQHLYQKEGLSAFTAGFKIRLLGISLYGSFLFSFYELGGKFFGEYINPAKQVEELGNFQ